MQSCELLSVALESHAHSFLVLSTVIYLDLAKFLVFSLLDKLLDISDLSFLFYKDGIHS